MAAKKAINTALTRAFGYQLQRVERKPRRRRRPPPDPTSERLLTQPAFILSTVRSGSTLLRVMLNSHPDVHSPIELHLRDWKVDVASEYAERSLREIGLDATQLEYLLWDRTLARELHLAGKRMLVNKTPSDVYIVDRIKECWPDARFIFLLRHPAAIARSRHAARPQDTAERNAKMVNRYGSALEEARSRHEGLTVRYEELATEPERVMRGVCDFLGLPWDPDVLDYGRHDHGRYKAGMGDWSEKIRSGKVQPPAPIPDGEIPDVLRELSAAWGYAPAHSTA